MIDMTLPEALESLDAAQAAVKETEESLKIKRKHYDHLSIEVVPRLMEAAGLDSVTRGDRVTYLRTDLRANADAAQRGALASALREMDEGDLITEYVFPQTLSAWVKDRLEEGLPIPPQINITRVRRAVPRKK